MKRLVYLATAALVALMILVPAAMAQDTAIIKEGPEEATIIDKDKKDLPKSGGPAAGTVLLPAAALLLGGGVLAYAVLRRR